MLRANYFSTIALRAIQMDYYIPTEIVLPKNVLLKSPIFQKGKSIYDISKIIKRKQKHMLRIMSSKSIIKIRK